MIFQWEEGGARVGEEFLGGKTEMPVCWREDDERLAKPRHEHGDGVEKFGTAGSQCEDDRHCICRPGAELERVVKAEFNNFLLHSKCLTKDMCEFRPVEFQGNHLIGHHGISAAGLRLALTHTVQRAVSLEDHFVRAAAI